MIWLGSLSDETKAKILGFFDNIGAEMGQKAKTALGSLGESIREFVMTIPEKVLNFALMVGPMIDKGIAFLGQLGPRIAKAITDFDLGGVIRNFFRGLFEPKVINGAAQSFDWGKLMEGIMGILFNIGKSLFYVTKFVLEIVWALGKALVEGIIELQMGIWGAFAKLFGGVGSFVGGAVNEYIVQPIWEALKYIGSGIADFFAPMTKGASMAFEAVGSLGQTYIVDPIMAVFTWFSSLYSVINGLVTKYIWEPFKKAMSVYLSLLDFFYIKPFMAVFNWFKSLGPQIMSFAQQYIVDPFMNVMSFYLGLVDMFYIQPFLKVWAWMKTLPAMIGSFVSQYVVEPFKTAMGWYLGLIDMFYIQPFLAVWKWMGTLPAKISSFVSQYIVQPFKDGMAFFLELLDTYYLAPFNAVFDFLGTIPTKFSTYVDQYIVAPFKLAMGFFLNLVDVFYIQPFLAVFAFLMSLPTKISSFVSQYIVAPFQLAMGFFLTLVDTYYIQPAIALFNFLMTLPARITQAVNDYIVAPFVGTMMKLKTLFDDYIKAPFEAGLAWFLTLSETLSVLVNDNIVLPITNMAATLKNAGFSLVENLLNGVKENWNNLKNYLGGGIQGLRDMLPGSEPADATSPLVGLGDAGSSFLNNILLGMQDNQETFKMGLAAILEDSATYAIGQFIMTARKGAEKMITETSAGLANILSRELSMAQITTLSTGGVDMNVTQQVIQRADVRDIITTMLNVSAAQVAILQDIKENTSNTDKNTKFKGVGVAQILQTASR